jgi:hypothetical protein
MRALSKIPAVTIPILFLSVTTVAQSGEFAAAIPGEVFHRGYALQDERQRLQSSTTSQSASTPAEIEIALDGFAAQQLGSLERFS